MKAIDYIDLKDSKSIIDNFQVNERAHQIPVSNTTTVKTFLQNAQSDSPSDFVVISYKKDDVVVNTGVIAEPSIAINPNFSYAKVPLGFILKGEVIVIKNDKATKKLGEGDFIGLFETSDWISTNRTMQIGDWTLVANGDTQIIFFGSTVISKTDDRTKAFRDYLVNLARNDRVPQPITTLPLLDWVAAHTTDSRLDNCIIIAHTHLLPNNLPFFRQLAYLVGPSNIFLLEKPYSTVKSVFNDLIRSGIEVFPVGMETGRSYEFATQKSLDVLWKRVFEEQKKNDFRKILIVDDGGDVWLSIPWQNLDGLSVAGVEQTQRGITRIQNSTVRIPPIVSVASSGIKKIVEAEFIGHSIVKNINKLGLLDTSKQIGIIGMGTIGSAILELLQKLGKKPIFYDLNSKNIPKLNNSPLSWPSLDSLINDSDLVIGTTGTDALKGVALDRVKGQKTFVSASSADIEFASLLKLSESIIDPFGTIKLNINSDLTISILNGGFPINFNRKEDATPAEDIVLTRSLMYIGSMQAIKLFGSEPAIYNVDKISQKHLLEKWIDDKQLSKQIISITKDDVETIVGFSGLEKAKDMPSIWKD